MFSLTVRLVEFVLFWFVLWWWVEWIIYFLFLCEISQNKMSGDNNSDSSTSESEVSACSSNYNPLKALYSRKSKAPVRNAPMFENILQFEASQKNKDIFAVGESEKIKIREDAKEQKRIETEKQLEEKNKLRFAKYECKFEVMFTVLS